MHNLLLVWCAMSGALAGLALPWPAALAAPPSLPAPPPTPAPLAAPAPAYSPLELAVTELAAQGYPPPTGYQIVEVPSGSLGAVPAVTDTQEQTIEVDVGTVMETLEEHGDASPEAVVGALAMVLRHEYHHTQEYGVSTPGYGGYGNGLCAHAEIADEDMAFYCDTIICETSDPSARAALCSHRAKLAEVLDSKLELRKYRCSSGGPFTPVPACPCCP